MGLCPVGDRRSYGFGNVTGPRLKDPLRDRLERLRDRFAGSADWRRNISPV